MFNFGKTTRFALAILAQVLVIVVIIVYKTAVSAGGTSIYLQLQPVDPRDMLRGDYVTVSYQVSNVYYYGNQPRTIPLGGYYNDNQYQAPTYDSSAIHNGDTVYVPLYKAGKFWMYSGYGISKTKPAANSCPSDAYLMNRSDDLMAPRSNCNPSDNVFLKGKVVSGGVDDSGYNTGYGNSQLRIEYGIETYFVPESKGQSLNLWNSSGGNNYAQVSVNADGVATLKRLFVNDKPWP